MAKKLIENLWSNECHILQIRKEILKLQYTLLSREISTDLISTDKVHFRKVQYSLSPSEL